MFAIDHIKTNSHNICLQNFGLPVSFSVCSTITSTSWNNVNKQHTVQILLCDFQNNAKHFLANENAMCIMKCQQSPRMLAFKAFLSVRQYIAILLLQFSMFSFFISFPSQSSLSSPSVALKKQIKLSKASTLMF